MISYNLSIFFLICKLLDLSRFLHFDKIIQMIVVKIFIKCNLLRSCILMISDDIQRIELETFTKGEGDNANKCFKFVLCFQKIKI